MLLGFFILDVISMQISNTKAHNGNEVLLIHNEVFMC